MSDRASSDSDAVLPYFTQIEALFIGLRGAPLLLSPADYRVARDWHRQGIPLDVVQAAIQDVFAARQDREARDKVRGLRYCRRAVESRWRQVADMRAPDVRAKEVPVDVPQRLGRLAASLPESLPDADRWRREITSLDGELEEAEAALSKIESRLLQHCLETLEPAARQCQLDEVEAVLARVATRIEPPATAAVRQRILHDRVRRQFSLPQLSLFAVTRG